MRKKLVPINALVRLVHENLIKKKVISLFLWSFYFSNSNQSINQSLSMIESVFCRIKEGATFGTRRQAEREPPGSNSWQIMSGLNLPLLGGGLVGGGGLRWRKHVLLYGAGCIWMVRGGKAAWTQIVQVSDPTPYTSPHVLAQEGGGVQRCHTVHLKLLPRVRGNFYRMLPWTIIINKKRLHLHPRELYSKNGLPRCSLDHKIIKRPFATLIFHTQVLHTRRG